jgi:hypothetical protein
MGWAGLGVSTKPVPKMPLEVVHHTVFANPNFCIYNFNFICILVSAKNVALLPVSAKVIVANLAGIPTEECFFFGGNQC